MKSHPYFEVVMFQTVSVDKVKCSACNMVYVDHIKQCFDPFSKLHYQTLKYTAYILGKTFSNMVALHNSFSSCDVMCSVSVLLFTLHTVHIRTG